MKKAVITDLDGTLTIKSGVVGDINYSTLLKLGDSDIIRIIATGRSLYSVSLILPDDFPIDYLIFSTGAGILNWKTKELIFRQSLANNDIQPTINQLIDNNYNFMIHLPVPDNHKFYYHKSHKTPIDFETRIKRYINFTYDKIPSSLDNISQFLVVLDENSQEEYSKIKDLFPELNVIRTTSPFDNKSIWVEIFPREVSKGKAVHYLSEQLNITKENIIIIGNDYNDIDMLDWGEHSYIVSDAPNELKEVYKTGSASWEHGFSKIIFKHYNWE